MNWAGLKPMGILWAGRPRVGFRLAGASKARRSRVCLMGGVLSDFVELAQLRA